MTKHNGMRSLTWETPVGLKSHHLWANFSAVRTGKSQFARGTDGLHRSASHRHHSWYTHMFGQVGAFGVHVVPASEQAEGKQQSHFGNTGHWRVILTGNVQSSCVRRQRLLNLNQDQKRSASLCPVAKQRRRLIKSFFFLLFFFYCPPCYERRALEWFACEYEAMTVSKVAACVMRVRLNIQWKDASCRSNAKSDANKTEAGDFNGDAGSASSESSTKTTKVVLAGLVSEHFL